MLMLKNILEQLLSAQRQLDVALEMLPNTPNKKHLISARKNLRDYFNSDIVPKWRRLSSILSIDPKIEIGVKELTNFEGNIASRILVKNIYPAAFDCLRREKKLIHDAQRVGARLERSKGLSGILDWFTSDPQVSDMKRGTQAFQYFYDRAITYENSPLPKTFDEFIDLLNKKSPALVDGLGGTINSIEQDIGMPEYQVRGFMENVANVGEGHLPENLGVFQQMLGKSAADPSIIKAIRFALTDTTITVAEGLQEAGTVSLEALSSSKNIVKFLPYILLGAGALAALYYMPRKRWQ